MQKSIKLAIASILVGTIGMVSIPASYASSAIASGQKTTVGATGQPTLIAKGKKKVSKMKAGKRVKRVGAMQKR
jgi:peroxiredoxin family protein